jgi:glutamyl-tRNA synthetase
MGWSYDDRTEFFTMLDLIEKFSIEHLNPSPAAINYTKLDHFNGLHIRALPVVELARRLRPFFEEAGYHPDDAILLKIAPILQERLTTLDEAPELADFFFQETVDPDPMELVAKGLTAGQSAVVAEQALQVLSALPAITPEIAEEPMRALVDKLELKPAQVFGILRVAVTGKKVSPPLFESMEIIGREKVLERIQNAIDILNEKEGA